MNREIKFRAYIFEEKRHYKQICHTDDYLYRLVDIVSSDGVNNTIKIHFDLPFMQNWITNVKGEKTKFVLEQFTGEYDKNGKEIYENDIVNSNYFKNGKVVFWRSGWHFNTGKDCHHSFNTSKHSFEIIGNIHENPELL